MDGVQQPVDLLHHPLVVHSGRLIVAQQGHLASHPCTLAYLTDAAHLSKETTALWRDYDRKIIPVR